MPGGIENDPAVRAALEPAERIQWHGQPGARELFLSVVPALIRDVVFLAVVGFALYAGWGTPVTAYSVVGYAICLFLVWLLVHNLREGSAAGVSHYLVSDRRIVLLTPRGDLKQFVILPRMPDDVADRHRLRWLDGEPLVGRVVAGRATIRIGYKLYRRRTINNYPDMVYRHDYMQLYGVAEPARAIAAIVQLRRDHRRPDSDPDDLADEDYGD